MKTVDADPRFDAVVLGELKISWMKAVGGVAALDAKFALANKKTKRTYAYADLQHPDLFSERTRKLVTELSKSLEKDAAIALFHESEERKEGIHESEPAGLADDTENDQQL
ncbi:MAG: hypothetical protein KAY24_20040 [Candidatus Eisenbacteria sp.]|nr:hypothetical protein [Candidatus Eisenbacteria bacterium]